MVEHDLFDFLLLSLPDNDTHSHKYGPFAQVDSIAAADRQIARVMDAGGGSGRLPRGPRVDRLLATTRSPRSRARSTSSAPSTASACAPPSARARTTRSPSARTRAPRRSTCSTATSRRKLIPRIERTLLALEGVDLVMRMGDHPDGEAIVRGERSRGVKEVRFAPRGDLVDARGARWSVEGDLDLLGLKIEDDQVRSATYPDALSRVWSRPALPDLGRGAGLRPPGLRVPGLGRRPPRRRRVARLAARQRLQRGR